MSENQTSLPVADSSESSACSTASCCRFSNILRATTVGFALLVVGTIGALKVYPEIVNYIPVIPGMTKSSTCGSKAMTGSTGGCCSTSAGCCASAAQGEGGCVGSCEGTCPSSAASSECCPSAAAGCPLCPHSTAKPEDASTTQVEQPASEDTGLSGQ